MTYRVTWLMEVTSAGLGERRADFSQSRRLRVLSTSVGSTTVVTPTLDTCVIVKGLDPGKFNNFMCKAFGRYLVEGSVAVGLVRTAGHAMGGGGSCTAPGPADCFSTSQIPRISEFRFSRLWIISLDSCILVCKWRRFFSIDARGPWKKEKSLIPGI